MSALPGIVRGEWGMAALIDSQCSRIVEYDDDECECDEDLIDEDHECDEGAICYRIGESSRAGEYSVENYSSLRSVSGFHSEWIASSNLLSRSLIYAVMPVPLIDCHRIKIGITGNLEARLKQFRTSCPYALLVGIWPGKKSDEERAHRVLGADRIGSSEVFDCRDVWKSLERIHGVLNEPI